MTEIMIYGAVFVAGLLVFDTLLRALFGARRKSAEVNSRLETLQRSANRGEAYRNLLRKRTSQDRNSFLAPFRWVARLYEQSGLELATHQRFLSVAAIFVASWFAISLFYAGPLVIKLVLQIVLTVTVTVATIAYMRARRIRKFVNQLPNALDIIVRSLNAGHPLGAAIALVAREMPDPIGSEFGILSDQLAFGGALDDSMLDMVERVGAEEVKLLAVTLTVQQGTGGNLAELLENLATMVRERLMLRNKIRAISAEGRATAAVLAASPFVLFFMLNAMVPTYFDPLWESGYGTEVVVVCLTMMAIGTVILNRMVNFDF
ncbi:type II secretion system F family protein [Rhodovulum sp. YNF3179]|uniref:type II secretion system F family protein n=1 Tax=Rhodovulum sp. YNF3179 TaxID=3425127 RepID=UPI003D328579